DSFASRSTLYENIDNILALANRLQKDARSGQVGLFGAEEVNLSTGLNLEAPVREIAQNEQLAWERELLGIYLSSHPLSDYQALLAERTVSTKDLASALEGALLNVGGLVTDFREIITKR